MTDLGWWIIHGDEIMAALEQVADGETPAIVYAELYANAEIHQGEANASEE